MFKLHDVHARKDMGLGVSKGSSTSQKTVRRQLWYYLLDILILTAMSAILFWGISTQFPNSYNDVTRYQCYANVFWKGVPGLASLPKQQCAFLSASSSVALIQKMQAYHFPVGLIRLVQSQPASQPFHALPPEYPLLTIVLFTPPLIAPQQWYQVGFALWMIVVAAVIYFMLKRYQSTRAAIAFAIYLAIGSWATALGRFDLIPAGLTLGAVILALRRRWVWAFVLLAFATLLKFYPIVLVVPFLIAQQMQSEERWSSWRRWSGLGVFVALCIVVTVGSLLLNVADTLEPINFFVNRPTQIESLQASILWLGHFFGYKTSEVFTYQSLNLLSPLASKVSLVSTLCLGVGLLYTFWVQWRGKVDLATASLFTLLIVMVTGKVFSPQYLMWVTPLIAYVGGANWKWVIGWLCVGALTTVIFPYLYDNYLIDRYFWVIVVRNAVMLVFTLGLLLYVGFAGRTEKFDAGGAKDEDGA